MSHHLITSNITPNNFNQFAKTVPSLPPQSSISEYRTWKKERGLLTHSFLNDPKFSLLANNVVVENMHITLPEVAGHRFSVRIYRPKKSIDPTLPVMLHFHGGYWVAGDANSEDFDNRAIIARGNDIIIISLEYRLIPEVKWHTVFSDAEFAMKWLSMNAASLGGDTSKGFLVSGAEAGADLAAITAIRARDKYPNIKITGQNLIVPTTLAYPDLKIPEEWQRRLTSHTENAGSPVLSRKMYEMFLSALAIPDEEKRKGENFPIWADLRGLPPAYIPTDECDPISRPGLSLCRAIA